jgi:serine/threonine protein phosphatase 1
MMQLRSAAIPTLIAASMPPDTRIYAVGDIHGRADLLSETIARIEDDLGRRPIARAAEVYLGDYIDRGPDSRDVIDILATRMVHNHAVCLRGNHEDLMERFLHNPDALRSWLALGGTSTLASYGVHTRSNSNAADDLHRQFRRAFPRAHELFLKCLRPWICCGDYLFVHAGIRPMVPLDRQNIIDLLWIRDDFLKSQLDHGKLIVHGHTPVPHPDVRHNRINIDTGAWYTGTLTCLMLEGTSIQFL